MFGPTEEERAAVHAFLDECGYIGSEDPGQFDLDVPFLVPERDLPSLLTEPRALAWLKVSLERWEALLRNLADPCERMAELFGREGALRHLRTFCTETIQLRWCVLLLEPVLRRLWTETGGLAERYPWEAELTLALCSDAHTIADHSRHALRSISQFLNDGPTPQYEPALSDLAAVLQGYLSTQPQESEDMGSARCVLGALLGADHPLHLLVLTAHGPAYVERVRAGAVVLAAQENLIEQVEARVAPLRATIHQCRDRLRQCTTVGQINSIQAQLDRCVDELEPHVNILEVAKLSTDPRSSVPYLEYIIDAVRRDAQCRLVETGTMLPV
jgi:uncharacterized coiled-coil protein SlyX